MPTSGAVYKSGTGTRGQGHWDACVGTWGRVGRDVGTSSMGRGDVWDGDGDGDAGTSNIGIPGDVGTLMFIV